VAHGGWLPLMIAGAVFALMTTWHRGSEIVDANRTRREGSLREFVARLRALEPPLPRVRGTAVFLNPSEETTPLALRANVEHNHVLHERVIILTIRSEDVPRVRNRERVAIDPLGFDDDNVAHVTARFGFSEQPDVPLALRLADALGLEGDGEVAGATYFLSRNSIRVTRAHGMSRWRKRLLVAGHNLSDPVEYFGLPLERTVMIGAQIPLCDRPSCVRTAHPAFGETRDHGDPRPA
jgi:KUP system potassium uptake protein